MREGPLYHWFRLNPDFFLNSLPLAVVVDDIDRKPRFLGLMSPDSHSVHSNHFTSSRSGARLRFFALLRSPWHSLCYSEVSVESFPIQGVQVPSKDKGWVPRWFLTLFTHLLALLVVKFIMTFTR